MRMQSTTRWTAALTAAATMLAAASAPAAITWGNAFNTVNGNSYENSGSLVSAINTGSTVGSTMTITADFESVTFVGSGNAPLGGAASGLNAGSPNTMQDIVNTVSFGGGPNTSFNLTGLTEGRLYQVQAFFTDDRAASAGRVMTFGSPGGNTVGLDGDLGGAGQTAVGTFVAGGATQNVTISTGGTAGNAHVNAYSVRDITKPLRNGGFELDGDFDFDVTGWTETGQVTGGSPLRSNIQTRTTGVTPSEGGVYLQLNGGNQAPGGAIHRDFSTVVGQWYELTLDFAKNGAEPGTAAIDLFVTNGSGTGGTLLLSESLADATSDGWSSYAFRFMAESTVSNLRLFDATTGSAIGYDALVDNVMIQPAVPAPAALPAGLALLALCVTRRPRRRC